MTDEVHLVTSTPQRQAIPAEKEAILIFSSDKLLWISFLGGKNIYCSSLRWGVDVALKPMRRAKLPRTLSQTKSNFSWP